MAGHPGGASSLAHRYVFGFNEDVTQNAQWADETTLVYAAGYNIVLFSMSDRKQRFIHTTLGTSENLDGFTSIAICPSRRFLAVAEKGEQPEVHVFDLKTLRKRKNLVFNDASSRCQFNSLAFTHDNENIVALAGTPEWSLVVWRWAKGKQLILKRLSDMNSPLSLFSLNPLDSETNVVMGPQFLKFYRMNETDVTQMRSQQDQLMVNGAELTCMCWLKQPVDHIVVGNNQGKIGLYGNGEFICFLTMAVPEGAGVSSLVAVTSGLICGLTTGEFYYLQRASEVADGRSGMFRLAHTWSAEGQTAPVSFMSLSPSEDQLSAVFANCQLYSVEIAAPTDLKHDDMKPVVSSFHGPGAITGLDVCIRKPLAITCSLDRTVRVWNYQDRTLDSQKTFSEDPHSVAFHPSGLHVIIGFSDKLRLLNLLMDDIRVYRELPIKVCREVQFSHGGQYFAAANVNGVVMVYNFYTCEKIIDLRGHSSKVKSIFWGADDMTLISSGQDGAVYRWDWEENKRLGEFVQKGNVYNCALANADGVIAVGSDLYLKELDLPELQVVKEIDSGAMLSQIVLTQAEHLLFAGTAAENRPGMLRAYEFPLSGQYLEYACMGSAITRMRITYDDQFLLVADESGCLCIFDVKDRQDRGNRSLAGAQRDLVTWSEEILVTRSDLEEKYSNMLELKNKVDELQLHNEYQLRLKDMSYSEKIKEITEKYMQDLEQDKNKFELLREEKNDMEMEYEERIKQMEDKHQHELQDAENAYQQKIMQEVEHYQKLVQERNLQQERWEEQRATLVATHERYIQELTDDFEQKLEEDRKMHEELEDEKNENAKEFEEMKNQLEDDIDAEIENLRDRYETQLNHERELTLRYKGENGIMKKKFTVLQKQIEDQKEDIKARDDKEQELNVQIKALNNEITAHKREIKNRDETIGDKEKKIYDLKKKNQELEKFKFVLDYKIKELKRQIEPRETEIASMKNQIKEMDRELEQFHRSNAQLDLMIGELRKKLDSMQQTIVGQRKRIGDQESVVSRFKSELHECVQFIQEPERLRTCVAHLHKQHVHREVPHREMDPNVTHEYHRHKDYLERTFTTLKEKFAMDVDSHSAENMRVMHDNMSLIREINKQREANRGTKGVLQTKIASLQRLRLAKSHQQLRSAGGAGSTAVMAAEMESNRTRIQALRSAVMELEGRLSQQQEEQRPISREILPPMDGAVPQSM